MKTKYLIIATVCSMLCMAGVQDARAQRVYKQGSTVVMDFGIGSGFPQTAVESNQGRKVVTGYSNTAVLSGNTVDSPINATIYKKLEVAPKDVISDVTWAVAYKTCTDKGTNWRLPTHREIIQMWIFREALVDLGVAPFLPGIAYWSATEYRATTVFALVDGQVGSVPKAGGSSNVEITSYTARCVRELP